MYNMSSAQGQRFAEVAREMTEKIKALGPSPAKKRGQGVQDSRGQGKIMEGNSLNP
jgi:hypothetical protein